MIPIPAIGHDDAHEIVAALYASLNGLAVTVHGDCYQVNGDPIIRRDTHGWPISAHLTLADDTRGDSIRVALPIQARPIPVRCHAPMCSNTEGHRSPHDMILRGA